MGIKKILRESFATKRIYSFLKEKKDKKITENKFKYHGNFIDRSKDHDKLCIILAGYKEYLYDDVFGRIRAIIENDIDVCVISSGLYSEKLASICEVNRWSYLSTKENDVGLVQNVAICKHPNAKVIFKLDEDIFITDGYFSKMIAAYHHAQRGDYNPGIVAPLLLVNGYASLRILEKEKKRDEFERRFGNIRYAAGSDQTIESNSKAARFMWGEENIISSLDELNRKYALEEQIEYPCPIRFSIGAILFMRELWEEMGYFDVDRNAKNMMGKDERKMCAYCCLNSFPIMVSENIVVGHFSFGAQTEGMKQYYNDHPERFKLMNAENELYIKSVSV